ncbi:hypothetical protein IAR55_002050 [Kwoniella newhampshirensis]|uniref:protein-histidine N-methyltransferase n=1 Tax=Kwoniella newhampshirensis TaxID=1651941 RepID=A0AAW0Z1I7_9TREE
MFKFDFQIDEDEEVQLPTATQDAAAAGPSTLPPTANTTDRRCHHLTIDELIKSLPEQISYSPLHHPSLPTPLLRRDLFDARFQLISSTSTEADADADADADSQDTQGEKEESRDGRNEEGEEYVDAKTDLIPGLYEGGLKTWEGGVDLVEVLAGVGEGEKDVGEWVKGGRVLEVGCGTALPTVYLLRSLLSLPPSSSTTTTDKEKTTLHLQDYNSLVLSLVTLPNLILASIPYLSPDLLHPSEESDEIVESLVPDLESPGHLTLTPDLVNGFKELLEQRGVELKFTYGHWEGLSDELRARKEGGHDGFGYAMVLTAETIYAEDSTPALISVLKAAIKSDPNEKITEKEEGEGESQKKEIELEDSLGDLSVKDDGARWSRIPLRERSNEGFVLVAAKILYFGVGGGLQAFLHQIENDGAHWSTVKDWVRGVGRKVVQVGW